MRRISARLPDGGGRRGLADCHANLEYERGARAGQAGGHVMMMSDPSDIIRLAREAKLNGKPAIEDPAVQEELVALMTEARSLGLEQPP